jgi:hypothetical protein
VTAAPVTILPNGTKVRTNETLDATDGMLVNPLRLNARKPNAEGLVCGVVGGHGGDVYWIGHEGSDILAPYCWSEFEVVS